MEFLFEMKWDARSERNFAPGIFFAGNGLETECRLPCLSIKGMLEFIKNRIDNLKIDSYN